MIGIFDSGSGGLTVLRELRRRAPHADVVYFGDLKNAPYGNKSREEIGALTVLGIHKLIDAGATEIISACNSVSVSIVLPMFDILDLPPANIIEMVGPTVRSFKGVNAHVLVLATKATIESDVYQGGFRLMGIHADGMAMPELVDLIEAGASNDVLKLSIKHSLAEIPERCYTHYVLGCTHYPLIIDLFKEVCEELGQNVILVDPAKPVVDAVVERFKINGDGTTTIHTSEESKVFQRFSEYALKRE